MLKRLLTFSTLYLVALTCAIGQTTLISPTGDGGFENGGTFAANGWTVVNGATNNWFLGAVGIPSAGANSAYISNDVAGATYAYTNNASSTVHFYRDITFPAGETSIQLSFKWKTQGEGSYDYVTVFSMPTSNTPLVNSPAGGFQSWLNIPTAYPGAVIHASPPNLNLQTTYQTQTVCLPASYAGTTRRLVFMWTNDGSSGTNPPGSIDEISLVSNIPQSGPANSPTSLVLTPFSVSQINGSFTAASGAPDGYLVVRYPAGSATTNPVNGTTYVAGNTLGNGTVVQSSALTSFSASGLTPSTSYDFYIYSYSSPPCSGGPLYKTTAPLFGTASTLACPALPAGTYTVGPSAANYVSLTDVALALANGTTGPVIFELQSTYNSSVETFPITFNSSACLINGTATIRPQTGASALSITSSNTTGTINFNGGDNIVFDGRAGGVGPSQLSISNTSTTGSTILLINGASSNTFKYLTISGVNTSTTSGVIFLSTTNITTGNSNNTFDNNDVKDGATTPTNLIYNNGTATTYLTQNNNIVISNSLFHDWFNATSTTASAAINVVAGASDWSITNNSFYQSVPRTFTMTTATDQGAIFINSVNFGFNFNITGNFIGGSAPLNAGAPFTWTGGATGTPTPRMIRFSAGTGSAFSNISNNTISNIAITTSSTSTSNGLLQHLNGNVNINNNTLGSQSATDNIVFTLASTSTAPFFYGIAYGLGSPVSQINVTNNNIGGITVTTNSTGTVSFRIVYGQPVALSKILINNNTIGGAIPNSIQQLTNNITAAIMILNPTIDDIVTNNTIRNITHNNVGVTGSLTGINVQASGGRHTITGNNIFNLTSNSTNVAINNAASVVGLTMTGSAVGGSNISNNTIYGLSNSNTSVAGWINGMYFGTSLAPQANTTIARNNVHSINLASATGGMAGIFLPNTGNAIVYNNMVRLGYDDAGASITTPLQINGIYKTSTGSMSIYHNTVYVGGLGVTGAVNTYAFRRTVSGMADTIMNNIFYNARSNGSGTGKHYAIFQSVGTGAPLVENFNDLYADGVGGVLGLLVTTDYTTLPTWQVAANQDWNSVSGDPKLINPTGNAASVNLHIQPASSTVIESAGYLIPLVALDYDNQTRSGLSPVDIGADAGNFLPMDQSPPVIYYGQLINTCGTGDRIIAGVNITDVTGIPLSGTLRPRIYYRKNGGTYFSQPGTFVSGTATNSIWNFTIVAADLGGLVPTDIVDYYIIAQDNVATPNIGSNPAGVIATNVNTVITNPVTPNTFTILSNSLSGTYTVGAAGNYATLTLAVAAYNSSCITGPVVFSLIDATYPSETFPITINANPFASSVNTLTIKPAVGNNPTISGSSATALFVLNGADWVTIDGSNATTPNTVCPPSMASRNLTLVNTSTSTSSAVVWLQTVASPLNSATNNTIKSVNLTGNLNTQTLIGVGSGSSTISTTSLGTGNNNNSYVNNNISKTQYGIYSQGINLSNKNTGTVINLNQINTPAPNNTKLGGIWVGFEDGITISGNNISEINNTTSPDIFAIGLGLTTSLSTTFFTGNEVTNATVSNNVIGTVINTGTFSAAGIVIANAQSGINTLVNNMISGVFANGTSGDFAAGIIAGGGPGSTTRIYFNTVSMSRSDILTGAAPTYALAVGGIQPNIDIRNNILVATGNNGTGVNVAIGLAYTSAPGNYLNLISNYNDLYVSGTGSAIGVTGSLASASGVPTAPGIYRTTLAAWQAETGRDLNSLNILPVFVSSSNLHLIAASNQCLDGVGTPIPGITTDIDCETRNSENPDIGADEFSGPVPTLTFTESSGLTPNDGIICSGAPVTFTVANGSTYMWSTGATTSAITVNPTTSGSYSVTVTLTGGCTRVFSQFITVIALPVLSHTAVEPTTCLSANGSIDLSVSGTGPFTYNWTTPNGSGIVNGQQDQSGLTVGSYFVTVTNSNGCTQTRTINLVGPGGCSICPTIGTLTTTPASPVCANTNFTITVSGLSSMGVTYGIRFIRSTTALPNPYVGGTIMADVPNGSLSGGGTSASATVSIPTGATYFLYAILNPPPADPTCRPSSTTTLVVNPTPNAVATPSSQTICSGSAITTIVLSGSVSGTTYTWTRDNTATVTGIAASGSGNIAGSLTNTTLSPVTVTFTITPTANGCTGPTTTATVTVNPTPVVNQPANQGTFCHGSTVPSTIFSSTVSGTTYTWTNNTPSIGLAASGSGNVPSFIAQNTTNGTVTATITVTPTYTNPAGGPTCSGTPKTYTITITQAPKAVCQNITVYLGPNGTVSITPTMINGGSSGGTLSATPLNFTCANVGVNSVTLTVTDACGFKSTCVAQVKVVDPLPPTINGVPADISLECNQALPPVPNVTATDNCSATLTYVQTSNQSSFANYCSYMSYDVFRTWTATDPSGNQTTKTQIIKIRDTKAPVFTSVPPAFLTVECDDDNANNQSPIASDACDATTAMVLDKNYVFNPNGCPNSYVATYTWTAGDNCGNTVQYVQQITVIDTTPPSITCPPNITMISPKPIAVKWADATGQDNCEQTINIKQTGGPASGSMFNPNTTTTITYTATDQCGNKSTCSFTVKIVTSIVNNGALNETENGTVITNATPVLYQNEPNPFENTTSIRFEMPDTQEGTFSVFTVDGRLIKQINEVFTKGETKITFNNADLPSAGLYFYQLKTKDFVDIKKMMLVR